MQNALGKNQPIHLIFLTVIASSCIKVWKKTIATDNSFDFETPMHVMACHHSEIVDEEFCVGWLYNQLGVGNNIRLRIKMMNYSNVKDIKIIGDQHGQFNDTLPKNKTR